MTDQIAKPFLKWAGGKAQLIKQLAPLLPDALRVGNITHYVEPFLGGGAIFLHVAQNFPVQEFFLFDVNPELILCYQAIQRDVGVVIQQVAAMEKAYLKRDDEKRRAYFYNARAKYNAGREKIDWDHFSEAWSTRAAQMIFLNRTCFNGLFRVNSAGAFNVPFGAYKKPRICDGENLLAVAKVLQRVELRCADFDACEKRVNKNTFVYFDPPYRPLSKTASFTSYSRYLFDDDAQRRLAQFYRVLDRKGARLMLSNSDPKNENPNDEFFDELYAGYNIRRVMMPRNINSDARKRNAITELLVMNY